MILDIEALLAPVSEDAPAGEDLAYDELRADLDDAFEAVLAEGFEGPEPEWRSLTKNIVSLLGRSKDVWLGVYLCRAGARTGDLELVSGGAQVLAGLLESWETVYPALGDLGPQGRRSPCDGLAKRREFLGPLEATALIRDSRHGSFTAADLERMAAQGESADNYIFFTRAMAGGGADQLSAALAHLDAMEAGFRRADAAFAAHAPKGFQPDFAALFQSLRKMRKAIQPFIAEEPKMESDATEADGDDTTSDGASVRTAAPSGAPGQISSRDDVIRALDAICAYYARQEPASPVPLALKRARAWVTLDFLALLNDIAPDSLKDARRVLTQNEKSGDSD